MGSERNQPKRNNIDAGGNGRTKKVVKSDAAIDAKELILDERLADDFLRECDEVSFKIVPQNPGIVLGYGGNTGY